MLLDQELTTFVLLVVSFIVFYTSGNRLSQKKKLSEPTTSTTQG